MRCHGFQFAVCALLVLVCLRATAQERPSSPGPRESRPTKATPATVDSVASRLYTTPESFYSPESLLEDTLDFEYHQYDPADNAFFPYATCGNLGSPARRLYFSMPMPKGVDIGHHGFDLYKSDFEHFRFYDTEVAMTRLAYSQGISQNDAMIRAAFGRNFAKGVNLSVNYQRINQLGQFTRQRAKDTAFGIGVMYRAPKGRLDGFYHYGSNSIVHEDNGGVQSPQTKLDSFNIFSDVPVRLADASTLHRMRELTLQHHFHLLTATNDSVQRKANLDVIHTLKIGSAFIKYADASITGDEPEYYGSFMTDDRGMRNYVGIRHFENALDLQFRYIPHDRNIPAHLLRVGLQWRNNNVDLEPEYATQQDVFLNASGRIGISEKITVDGVGYIGILDAIGEYRLEANARVRLFKDALTWAQLNLYQRNPSLTESTLYVDRTLVWRNDFKNVALSGVQFFYEHPSIRLRLNAGANVISNFIYFNSERTPTQLDRSVEILQLSAAKEITLGPFGVYAHLMLQEYDVNEVALPHLIGRGQVYFKDKIFKNNLLVRTGFELLVTDEYTGVSWFPVTGQFYYDETFNILQYPALDFFFSMQVEDVFKAFVKLENVTSFFSEDHYVQIADYPQFKQYFRLGLWMKLNN